MSRKNFSLSSQFRNVLFGMINISSPDGDGIILSKLFRALRFDEVPFRAKSRLIKASVELSRNTRGCTFLRVDIYIMNIR